MKTLWIVALAALACGARAQWTNALAPAGKRARAMTLVSRGRARCSILLPARPTTQERKAAADLQQWLGEISRVALPITTEGARLRGPAISVGATTRLAARVAPTVDLGDEGYGIARRGADLYLWGGRTRGVINAVYALLEEDMGCRWYTRESLRIPRMPELKVAPVERTYRPRLRLRDPFTAVSFDADWSLKNRTNAPSAPVPEEWGGRLDYGPLFVHTFHQLMPPDQYFAEHPDYYMLDADGKRNAYQLCTTNPETIRLVTAAVLKAFRENPTMELASVFKMDGGGICHCPRCTELRAAEGADMACQLVMVNQVAEAVEKAFPRATIDTLAYLDTIGVPRTMRPRKNVAIRLCNDAVGSWVHPFTAAEKCDIGKLTRDWGAACGRIYIWDYNVNFSHYLAPMPNLDVTVENIRFFVKHNAEGIMTQAGYQSPGAERDELRSWVLAKVMWDPSLDLQKLVLDFIYGHYGKAAGPIAAYDALLRQAGIDHAAELETPPGGIRYRMDHPFLSDVLKGADALFAQAEKLADDPVTLHRVERAELPILYVKLSRGPAFVGEGYPDLLARFERIARAVGVTHLWEAAPNLDQQLAAWKKAWEERPAPK